MPDSFGVLELPHNPVTDMTAGAERRPVTSEVAGSNPVVPANPFQRFPSIFKCLPQNVAVRLATLSDIDRHEMPPILGSNCSSYCST